MKLSIISQHFITYQRINKLTFPGINPSLKTVIETSPASPDDFIFTVAFPSVTAVSNSFSPFSNRAGPFNFKVKSVDNRRIKQIIVTVKGNIKVQDDI